MTSWQEESPARGEQSRGSSAHRWRSTCTHSTHADPIPDLWGNRESSKDREGGNWNDTVVFPTILLLQQTPLPTKIDPLFTPDPGTDFWWRGPGVKQETTRALHDDVVRSTLTWMRSSFQWGHKERLPGRPVVRTLRFHGRGYGFNPSSGNEDLACCMALPKRPKKQTKKNDDAKKKLKSMRIKKNCRAKKRWTKNTFKNFFPMSLENYIASQALKLYTIWSVLLCFRGPETPVSPHQRGCGPSKCFKQCCISALASATRQEKEIE